MNKKLVPLVIIGILLAIGVIFLSTRKKATPATTPQTSETPTATGPKSLKDLLSAGVAQECSFTDPEGNSGSVFITSGKMRGDFTTKSDKETIKSHMVVDGNTSYMWMDGQESGYKFSFDAANAPTPTAGQPQTFDTNKQMDYKCKPWIVTGSMFSLPGNIKFTDFSQLMAPKTTGTAPATGDQSACAACDQVPADAKAQCRTALGCK
jgi:hypothetical protein